MGHLGFSYVGALYLLMLFIPNIIWSRHRPADYDTARESRVLVTFERAGEVCCTLCAVIFADFNPAPFTPWTLWLAASFLLMLCYEICWIRYFSGAYTEANFYRGFLGVPVPLATLPVTVFLLLGIYGRVVWMIASAVILGIGHIGIHIRHLKAT